MPNSPAYLYHEPDFMNRDSLRHTSFSPRSMNDYEQAVMAEKEQPEKKIRFGSPVGDEGLFSADAAKFIIRVDPLIHLEGWNASTGGPLLFGGGKIRMGGKLWSLEWQGGAGETGLNGFQNGYVQKFEVLPGLAYARTTNAGNHAFGYGIFDFAWRPARMFELHAGRGKHFIGDGYRSLLLSYNAAPYTYLRFTTTIWKLQYTNLFAQLDDIRGAQGDRRLFQGKHLALHYLDWKIGSAVSIGIFEAIVWQSEDLYGARGMDLNYLNPVIFYRPVEFSLGSPDNALMGFNLKVATGKLSYLYAQAVLDEFNFQEVRKWDGWSSNKQGIQLGWRVINPLNANGLSFRLEGNYVRPYTYSHNTPLQNFTNLNEVLAHPLRANFAEGLVRLHYVREKWMLTAQFMMALYGEDDSLSHNGRDLFRPYPDTRHNYVGQGIRTDLNYGELTLRRWLNTASRLNTFGRLVYRSEVSDVSHTRNLWFHLGISTWFPDRYQDF